MRRSYVTFSWILPLLSLTVWFVAFAVPVAILFFKLEHGAAGSATVRLQSGPFSVNISRDRFLTWSINAIGVQRGHFIEAFNLPGFVSDLLLSFPTSWPAVWHPAVLVADAWRSTIWPFFCLPAWWMVGKGVDACLSFGRVNRAFALLGALLSVIFAFLGGGLAFGLSPSERDGVLYPIWGFALWTVLFCSLPLGWIVQRRRVPM